MNAQSRHPIRVPAGAGLRTSKPAPPLFALILAFSAIATTPMFALQNTFGEGGIAPTKENILGVLSLVIWLLALLVSFKYLFITLRIESRGAGGNMALLSAAGSTATASPAARRTVLIGLAGCAFLFAASSVTPAITALSAVEGLRVANPVVGPLILPMAVALIFLTFFVQRYATNTGVAAILGGLLLAWLMTIAVLGFEQIMRVPDVVSAFNPVLGVHYLYRNGHAGFSSLAGLVLVAAGVEVLYAAVGRLKASSIRLAWFTLVLPSLLLNYLGQGALLIQEPSATSSPFFHLVPSKLAVVVASFAIFIALIASREVISSTSSMLREAVQLGYLPRLEMHQDTSWIYVPAVNGILLLVGLALIVAFPSSRQLTSAMSTAVSASMFVTTVLVALVAWRRWHWSSTMVGAFASAFMAIDAALFLANATRFEYSGWVSLVLGLAAFILMLIWMQGRRAMLESARTQSLSLETFIITIEENLPQTVPGTAIFLTSTPSTVPQALLHNLKHNKILHERNVVLTAETLEAAYAGEDEKAEIRRLSAHFYQMVVRFGFAERPDLPRRVAEITNGPNFHPMETTFFASRETTIVLDTTGPMRWWGEAFAFLAGNAQRATQYFGIPQTQLVELGTHVEM